jgi:uracil-DNA glycosylase family 4
MKSTNKHLNENIKYYYHSTDIYNSLIYTKNNSSKNISSQKEHIEFLFSKIKKKFLRFNKIDNQFVFFDGSLNSKIMIIGDMPSKNDVTEMKLFTGAEGELLNKMLGAINLDRNKVYLTNAINFRVDQKDVLNNTDAQLMKKYLIDHILLVKPSIIYLLGSFALKILFDDKYNLTTDRGKWISLNIKNLGILVLPSFHPSFLLRHENQKRNAWVDLQNLQKKIDGLK